MKAKLIVGGEEFSFISELPISVNMAVADVREPDKRNSYYSKTISIPGTPEVIKKFEYIFEVNSTLTNFNPNLKTEAAYYVNDQRVFKGGLQLLRIRTRHTNQNVPATFECSIIGETGNLFLDISGLYLTDIDFSEYDHSLTYASGSSMFNPTLGSGYCYPYIDYGTNSTGAMRGTTWKFEHLKPAIFEREYVRKIFANAGYTWESGGYFDSDYAKHIIIPDVNEGTLKFSTTVQDENKIYVGRTTDDTNNYSGSYNGSFSKWVYAVPTIVPIPLNVDSSSGYYDSVDLYDTATFLFAPAVTAFYTVRGFLTFSYTINPPAGTVSSSTDYAITVRIEYSNNGGSSWNFASSNSGNQFTQPLSVTKTIAVEWNATIGSPTLVRFTVSSVNVNAVFIDSLSNVITTGTSSVDFSVSVGSYLYAYISNPELQYGETVDMNATIPRDVTQLDFLTSIIKSENLYIELDRLDSRKYIVESREDFIQETDPLDWTSKRDLSKEREIIPMGDLDAKRYLFTQKSDKDYFNVLYENEFKEVYGTERIDVNNDFIKNEKKIETVFAATPIAVHSSIDIVAPRFFKSDDGNVTVLPLKCTIRRLYWGGYKNSGSHTLTANGVNYTMTSYPFAGHVDDPENPTVDLCFDIPQRLYWTLPIDLYTNNNRYNERYSKFIEEITDPNSKIVKDYFFLNETDIAKFTFRKIVFVDDAYFFINKILDYDPQVEKTVLVEMLKLKKGATFSPGQSSLSSLSINNSPFYLNSANNYSMTNSKSVGQNNIVNTENSFVIGENNIVS